MFHNDSGMTSALTPQVLVLTFRLEVFNPRASSRFLGRATGVLISKHLGTLERNATNPPSDPRGKGKGSGSGAGGQNRRGKASPGACGCDQQPCANPDTGEAARRKTGGGETRGETGSWWTEAARDRAFDTYTPTHRRRNEPTVPTDHPHFPSKVHPPQFPSTTTTTPIPIPTPTSTRLPSGQRRRRVDQVAHR